LRAGIIENERLSPKLPSLPAVHRGLRSFIMRFLLTLFSL
jgi:hypothetical protein